MSDRGGYRIIVTGATLAGEARVLLQERGCQVAYVHGPGETGIASLADRMRDQRTQGLIVRQGKIDRAVLAASGCLRVVSKHGVGVDNIDLQAAAELGIVVTNTPTANSEAVAEHALALMLALARSLPKQDALVRQGGWDKRTYRGLELAGRTLGLVGYGRVGRRLAELVAPLHMPVLVYDPLADRRPAPPGITFVDHLDALLAQAEVVSLHCPLTPQTRGLIGAAQLRLMPRHAWLINTARGALVDEAALVRALDEGLIAGAALDTFQTEPPARDNPLLLRDDVILTNHVAGVSDASMRNMALGAVRNVLAVLDGEEPDPAAVVRAG